MRRERLIIRVSRWGRWRVIGAMWTAQLLVAYLVAPLWIASGNADGPSGRPWGPWRWDELIGAFSDPEFHLVVVVPLLMICAAQGVMLWPVRVPGPRTLRGTPLKLSLAVAALACTVLTFGAYFAIGGLVSVLTDGRTDLDDLLPFSGELWLLGLVLVVGAPWAIWSVLLIAFCRPAPRESLLARLSSRIFLGTTVETLAIIPLDVMLRRRSDCYCVGGTYWALTLCGAVGLFAAGPAIILPLLARRRKRWYAGRCDACGYDMSATPKAPRCPECGAGWRA
ncbi:MAG: hypothetical protein FJ255_09410 [Phycisphaerae bacterium]|nr:hypothetical protein [Phycisphaerae bacterium]